MLSACAEQGAKILQRKVQAVEVLLGRAVDRVFPCPGGPLGYRMKAELRATRAHDFDNALHYSWHDPQEGKVMLVRDGFPLANAQINRAMPVVMERVNQDPVLATALFETKFHTTTTGELMLSLVYREWLQEDKWRSSAERLQEELLRDPETSVVNLLGRSRKQAVILGDPFVHEQFTVDNFGEEHTFVYRQSVEEFSQPNAQVNKLMLQWALDNTRNERNKVANDLLEIYCGNGNFTAVVSRLNFDNALATEVGRVAVRDANYAMHENNIPSATIVRMSSEEITQAFFFERLFQRLRTIDLEDYDFRTILVDPPRQGLDDACIRLLSNFLGQIVYISCNPVSLKSDLEAIKSKTPYKFEVTQLVCFDQFPNTAHIECGVIIETS